MATFVTVFIYNRGLKRVSYGVNAVDFVILDQAFGYRMIYFWHDKEKKRASTS